MTQEQQKARLTELETQVREGEKMCAFALRNIRDEELFKVAGFTSFDKYCEETFSRTRQWASQQIHRLELLEALKEAGFLDAQGRITEVAIEVGQKEGQKGFLDLPLSDSVQLQRLSGHSDLVFDAIKAGVGKGKKQRAEAVKQAVDALELRKKFREKNGVTKEEDDVLYEVYSLSGISQQPNLLAIAQQEHPDKPLPVALMTYCRQHRVLPQLSEILAARSQGVKFIELFANFTPLAKQWKAEEKTAAEIERERGEANQHDLQSQNSRQRIEKLQSFVAAAENPTEAAAEVEIPPAAEPETTTETEPLTEKELGERIAALSPDQIKELIRRLGPEAEPTTEAVPRRVKKSAIVAVWEAQPKNKRVADKLAEVFRSQGIEVEEDIV